MSNRAHEVAVEVVENVAWLGEAIYPILEVARPYAELDKDGAEFSAFMEGAIFGACAAHWSTGLIEAPKHVQQMAFHVLYEAVKAWAGNVAEAYGDKRLVFDAEVAK